MKSPHEPVKDEDTRDALYWCRDNLNRLHAFLEGMLSQMDEKSHSFNRVKHSFDPAITNMFCYINTLETTTVRHEVLIARLRKENEKLNNDLDNCALELDKVREEQNVLENEKQAIQNQSK